MTGPECLLAGCNGLLRVIGQRCSWCNRSGSDRRVLEKLYELRFRRIMYILRRREFEMGKNNLSVFLLKKGSEDPNKIFRNSHEVLKQYDANKIAYYSPSVERNPPWLDSFFQIDNISTMSQSNSRAVLLVKRVFGDGPRMFAVSFGFGKWMLNADVIENGFGIRVALNSANENDLRKINKTCVGSNQKQSMEQIPKSGNISEFGLNIENDLVTGVTVKVTDEIFGSGNVTGSDLFNVSAERTVQDIEDIVDHCYKKYREDSYKEHFGWIDMIKRVRGSSKIRLLDEKLLEHILAEDFERAWMAVPEVLDWEKIRCFKYSGSADEFDDIYIEEVLKARRGGTELTIEHLKHKPIVAVSSLDEHEYAGRWTAYKCIVAEIEHGGHSYCLSNGIWYQIDSDFAGKVNREYDAIPVSSLECCPYFPNGDKYNEDVYNEELHKYLNGSALIHKVGEISYGGGSGNRIEVCDLLTKDRELVHVKKLTTSAPLSHLFNQGIVSSEALLDPDFREKWNERLDAYDYCGHVDRNFTSSNYTIVYAIICKGDARRPRIPFFSRVAIRHAVKTIKQLNYKDVQILAIPNLAKK